MRKTGTRITRVTRITRSNKEYENGRDLPDAVGRSRTHQVLEYRVHDFKARATFETMYVCAQTLLAFALCLPSAVRRPLPLSRTDNLRFICNFETVLIILLRALDQSGQQARTHTRARGHAHISQHLKKKT